MKVNNYVMPQDYEYLNLPLGRAQEYVFLINAEIEKMDDNSEYDDKLVKLQRERQAAIADIKHDFEMQSWEDGPIKFLEIEKVIDHQFSDDAYYSSKPALLESGKSYSTSKYWYDKLDRNLEYFNQQELELRKREYINIQEEIGHSKERKFIYGDGFIMG
jgi:hypothetical protein